MFKKTQQAQCNYDFDVEEPSWDGRRKPTCDHLVEAGQAAATAADGTGMKAILTQFPTMNRNTRVTCVMSPGAQTYEDMVWFHADEFLEEGSEFFVLEDPVSAVLEEEQVLVI